MNSFLKSCWHRRWFRVCTWLFASLVTALVLFHQWVNWKGARAWRAAQDMFASEGESLDIRKGMVEPAPDDRNFCAIPALRDLALVVDHDPDKGAPAEKRRILKEMGLPTGEGNKLADSRPKLAASAALGTPTDLKAWADWLRKEGSLTLPPDSGNAARDVLAALSKHDAFIGELAAALDRPEAQWMPAWKTRELPPIAFDVPLPHYQPVQAVTQMLCLRSIAAARAGEAAKAHESLLMALRLARASLNDPFVIGLLVAMAQIQQIQHAIWEVCEVHAGSADDFRRLQEELTRLDFQDALLRVFRTEFACGTSAVMWMKQQRDARLFGVMAGIDDGGHTSGTERIVVRSIPAGWFDMNAATMVQLAFVHVLKPLRDGGLKALGEETSFERELKVRKGELRPDSIMACLVFPAVVHVSARAVYVQCQTNQAIAACALERWFSGHQSYPDSLDLADRAGEKPLPMDVLSERLIGYRKSSEGRYALWCIGFDGKDDGGKRVLDEKKPDGTKFFDRGYTGDWVWDFPQK